MGKQAGVWSNMVSAGEASVEDGGNHFEDVFLSIIYNTRLQDKECS